MNKTFKTSLVSALVGLLIASSLQALAAPPKPEKLIQWRQSAYRVIEWNVARIKNSLEGQYNKDEVAKAANTIAVLASSGLGSLFAPGTEQGKGWHATSTKPEFFKDGARVGELAGNFTKEANELNKVAATGDAAAIKTQFAKLTRSCKACHDDYKESE